jgi:hypothetical protein
MRSTTVLAAGVAALLVAPAAARADGDGRWYGWQTLALDGAAFGGGAIAGVTRSEPVAAGAAALYLLGPAVVHLAHDRRGAAAASAGLRAAVPLAAALAGGGVGLLFARDPDPDALPPAFRGALVGIVIGVVGAVALDAAVLAREDAPSDDPSAFALGWAW